MIFTADQIVAHLVGDYLLQSHWMAIHKGRRDFPAIVHAVCYTLPFALITQDRVALALICCSHFIIDRWRLARFVQAELRAFLMKYYGTGGQDQDCADPLHTASTRARFGLVMVEGEPYQIVDIGMRMLSVRELFRAQGFREDYIVDRGIASDGSQMRLTKTASIRMCGNSVCPPVAEALVRANYVAVVPASDPAPIDLFREVA